MGALAAGGLRRCFESRLGRDGARLVARRTVCDSHRRCSRNSSLRVLDTAGAPTSSGHEPAGTRRTMAARTRLPSRAHQLGLQRYHVQTDATHSALLHWPRLHGVFTAVGRGLDAAVEKPFATSAGNIPRETCLAVFGCRWIVEIG